MTIQAHEEGLDEGRSWAADQLTPEIRDRIVAKQAAGDIIDESSSARFTPAEQFYFLVDPCNRGYIEVKLEMARTFWSQIVEAEPTTLFVRGFVRSVMTAISEICKPLQRAGHEAGRRRKQRPHSYDLTLLILEALDLEADRTIEPSISDAEQVFYILRPKLEGDREAATEFWDSDWPLAQNSFFVRGYVEGLIELWTEKGWCY